MILRQQKLLLAALIAAAGSAAGCFLGFGDYKVGAGTTGSGGADAGAGTGGASSSGAGGGGVGAGCPKGSTSDFQDDFEDNKTDPAWALYASDGAHVTVVEAFHELRITNDGAKGVSGGYLWNNGPRSLLGCKISVEVVQVASVTDQLLVHLYLRDDLDATKNIGVWELAGILYFGNYDGVANLGSVKIPYDAKAHHWWRMRETNGSVYFDTSPDGKTWSSRHSIPTPPLASAGRVDLGVLTVMANVPGGGTTIFDNLNVAPP